MFSLPFRRNKNGSLKIDLAKSDHGRDLPSSLVYQLCGIPVRANCGHLTKLKGVIEAFGEVRICKLFFCYGEIDYCLSCLAEKTIRCAWCGRSIFVGDPVTTYPPDPLTPIPFYAVFLRRDLPLLIGCCRPECNGGQEYKNGYWHPNGYHLAKVDTIDWQVLQKSKAVLTV